MMERPSYLGKYLFDWESFDVVLGGKSALDSKFFVGQMADKTQVKSFLEGYGLDNQNPVTSAELFGNFQEALQFIRRYFLKEGNPEGLDFKIPNSITMITNIEQLFLMATGNAESTNGEETLWAEAVLKVMHTILHADKDLRSSYFSIVQTQILDRFYRYIYRDKEGNLFLGLRNEPNESIELLDFETKSKKSRDSVIIKLLHKAENVAEELFDRIGIRIITKNRLDTLRSLRYLLEKNIIIPHNIKPSRSMNSLVDLEKFRDQHNKLVKLAIKNELTEERFIQAIERDISECEIVGKDEDDNLHSSHRYQAIQFTCRHLIHYKNPFLTEFNELRRMAKDGGEQDDLAKKILSMDISLISRDIRFFYPFEVQIVDQDSHKVNTEGEASHLEYKKSQVQAATSRIFGNLIDYKASV